MASFGNPRSEPDRCPNGTVGFPISWGKILGMRHGGILAGFLVGVWLLPLPLAGNTAVLRGKIEMEDGSPPNRAIGIERYCQNGARQVAVADRKGVFVFSMEIDPLTELACVLRAVLDGY